jgi:hypothetical protein
MRTIRLTGLLLASAGVLLVAVGIGIDLIPALSSPGLGPNQILILALGAVLLASGWLMRTRADQVQRLIEKSGFRIHEDAPPSEAQRLTYISFRERRLRLPLIDHVIGAAPLLNLLLALVFIYLMAITIRSLDAEPSPVALLKIVVLAVLIVTTLGIVFFRGKGLNAALFSGYAAILLLGHLLTPALRFPDIPEALVRRPTPYIMFTGEPFIADHNALGYRGALPEVPKPAGEYRVLFLGSSVVYDGYPLSQAIPGHLERIAHEARHPEMKVYNWGVVSAVSGMEVSTILHRAVNYQPDLIILYDGGNDMNAPYTFDPRPGHPFNFAANERTYKLFDGNAPFTLVAAVLAQNRLLRTLFFNELNREWLQTDALRESVNYGSEEWETQIVTNYLHNLDLSCQLAESFGFRLATFLYPINPLSDTIPSDELTDRDQYLLRQYDRIRIGYAELNRQHGGGGTCVFIDLSLACKDRQCAFKDTYHADDASRPVIAAQLYEYLEQYGLASQP